MNGLNKDDIIRMAAKSGMHFYQFGWTTGDDKENLYPECVYTENLEKFANLVAAAEREAIIGLLKGIDQTDCESKDGYWETSFGAAFGKELLSTIRARGNNAA